MMGSEKPHLTIEERGEDFAWRLKQRMYLGQEKIYPYIALRHEEILKLPRLATGVSEFPGRRRFEEDVRFDPITGAIYTTRWRKLETFIDPGERRTITSPEDYTFIIERPSLPNPEDLPRRGEAIGLIAAEVWEGLEPAIRQQDHIFEGYQPARLTAEPQKLRRIFYWIDQTAQKFKERAITKDQLEQLSQQAAELITQAGLTTAVDKTKKRLAMALIKATGLDNLGRLNPMISRVRMRSALLAATRRIVVSDLVRRKFSANLEILVAEREFTRYNLEQAYNKLNAVRHKLQDSTRMAGIDSQVLASEIKETATDYLTFPRVAPYLIPSRLAAILLIGCREEKKEVNRQVLGQEVAEEVFSFTAVTTLLAEGNINKAERRIFWASSILETALKENEAIFIQTID